MFRSVLEIENLNQCVAFELIMWCMGFNGGCNVVYWDNVYICMVCFHWFLRLRGYLSHVNEICTCGL